MKKVLVLAGLVAALTFASAPTAFADDMVTIKHSPDVCHNLTAAIASPEATFVAQDAKILESHPDRLVTVSLATGNTKLPDGDGVKVEPLWHTRMNL